MTQVGVAGLVTELEKLRKQYEANIQDEHADHDKYLAFAHELDQYGFVMEGQIVREIANQESTHAGMLTAMREGTFVRDRLPPQLKQLV